MDGVIFAYILLCFLVAMLVMMALNPVLPEVFCRVMGWHLAPKEQGFDGCSYNGTCPRCGKKVLQDSQGNWF